MDRNAWFRSAMFGVLVIGSLWWMVGSGVSQSQISPLGEAEFLAVGNNASPFIHFYERQTDTNLTKLSDPTDLPNGTVTKLAWHPDGSIVAAAHQGGENLTLYSRSGSNFTKIAGVEGVEGDGWGVAFSPDGDHLYVAHANSPFFTVYESSGDTYVKASQPSVLPSSDARAVAASPDGVYVAVAQNDPADILVYKWVEGVLDNFEWPSTLPGTTTRDLEWSNDGVYLAAGAVNSPVEKIWKQSGDDFTEIHTHSDASQDRRGVSWAPDGRTVAWALNSNGETGFHTRTVLSNDTVEDNQAPETGVEKSDDVDFSDGARGFVAAGDRFTGFVRWHDHSGRSIVELDRPEGAGGSRIISLAWSPGSTGRPTTTPGEEGFEEQVPGLLPISNWYKMGVFDGTCTGGFPDGEFSVSGGGPGDSTLMYRHDKPADETALSCWFFETLDVCDVGEMRFDFRWDNAIPGNFPENIEDQRLGWVFGAGGGTGKQGDIGLRVGGGGVVVLAVGPDGLAPGEQRERELATVFEGSPNTWYTAIFSLDCAGGTAKLEVEGEGDATLDISGFEDVVLNTLRLTYPEGFADAQVMYIDNLGISVVETAVPTEFTGGVSDFRSGLGFQTVESEFLFSIILIAVSLVIVGLLTTLLGNSRIRAYLAWVASMGVGVFCVAVLNLEFWMFVVAVVLGGAVLAGTGPLAGFFVGDVLSKRGRAVAAGAGSADGSASGGEDDSGEGGGQEESTMEAMKRLDESGELKEMREEAGITEGASAPEPAPESSGGGEQ